VARVDDKRFHWRDTYGVVHRMEDAKVDEYISPATLCMSCHAADRFLNGERSATDIEFGHADSVKIRETDLQDHLTCLQCIAIESRWIAR